MFTCPLKLKCLPFCQSSDVKHGPPRGAATGKTCASHERSTVLAEAAREIVGAPNVGALTGGGGTDAVDKIVSVTGGGGGASGHFLSDRVISTSSFKTGTSTIFQKTTDHC